MSVGLGRLCGIKVGGFRFFQNCPADFRCLDPRTLPENLRLHVGPRCLSYAAKERHPPPHYSNNPGAPPPHRPRAGSTAPVCWPGPRSWVCCCRTALRAGAASSGGPPGPSLWSGGPASHLGLESTQLGSPSATGRSPLGLEGPEGPRTAFARPVPALRHHAAARVAGPEPEPRVQSSGPRLPACGVSALEACAGLTHCGGACVHAIGLGKLLVQPSGRLLVGGGERCQLKIRKGL